jgi:carboxypeptidase Taq
MNTFASPERSLERLRELDRERMHLSRTAALLQWDQECYLPSDAAGERAEQLAVLEGLAHERLINPELGELLDRLEGKTLPVLPDGFPAGDFIRVLRHDYDLAVKLPGDFVREAARSEGLSLAAWVKARQYKDFTVFAPHLEKMIRLARQKSALWGWDKENLYDGLLDFFEPSSKARNIDPFFTQLGEKLKLLLKKVAARPSPDNAFLHQYFDVSKQKRLCREIITGIGFDDKRSRLDMSEHPFTTTLGYNDVRITTRYDLLNPRAGIFSLLHECGHAFYELGIDPSLRSSCLAEGASMGVHESMARLWENVIGGNRAFGKAWFARLVEYFPEELAGVDFETLHRALNIVKPGPIRVEADELSYPLHIILRFKLEEKLIAGTLSVNDLPRAWNAATKDYLGAECADDTKGVLQDIHWSLGSFGYFPTYVLGGIYALQFWDKMNEDIPDLEEALERKEYGAIHSWLREKIYRKGRSMEIADLMWEVTGREFSVDNLFNYLEKKYSELYGL